MSEYRHTPDSLAERLDELLPPGQPEQLNRDGDPLIEAAAWLASLPPLQISPEAMTRIQAQVVEAQQIQRSFSRSRFPRGARWALVASVMLVLLVVGTIPSALASVPGDLLYPVKQAVEQTELALARSLESSAVTHLLHAERRSQEASTLLARGQFNPDVINDAFGELLAVAQIVQENDDFDAAVRNDLERRTIIVNAQVNTVLALVSDTAQVPDSTVAPLLTEVYATQNSGGLLLPTATPTSMPSPTDAPVYTPTIATETPLPTATQSTTPSPLVMVTPTLTTTIVPTAPPVNLIIEGPVQAITGSVIVIYGFEIQLSSDDLLFSVIRIGDVVRIEGYFDGSAVIAIQIEIVGVDVAVNEAGEVWRDTGDCSNSPPSWAAASSWRTRCARQQQPGNAGGNNRGSGMGMGSGSGS